MIIEDMRADYHRNGLGGEGSYVAMFRVTDPDIGERVPFMGVFWNEGEEGPRECMVFRCVDIAEPLACYVEGQTPEGLGSRAYPARLNSWRSTDHFLPALQEPLRRAIEEMYSLTKRQFATS